MYVFMQMSMHMLPYIAHMYIYIDSVCVYIHTRTYMYITLMIVALSRISVGWRPRFQTFQIVTITSC